MTERTMITDQKGQILLSSIFELKCGEHFEISCENVISSRIKKFSFDDIELIECPDEKRTGTEFCEYVASLGFIPLNAFHAQAIISNKGSIENLSEMLVPYWRRKDFKLETISFFGSMATNGASPDQIYCFKYDGYGYCNPPLFMVFENDPGD